MPAARAPTEDFSWRDAERTVLFRHAGLGAAPGLLAEQGFSTFELYSTPRALAVAPELSGGAAAVREVPPDGVPEAAAELLAQANLEAIVAFGGGRVIDTAKAVAAVSGARVAAIPTTLSGAEMTGIHRLPAGSESRARGLVRPQLVIADPALMTSQPEAALRASAMNALAHGADSLYTPLANPVSRMCALKGAELIAGALDQGAGARDLGELALGSLLCGYAIDSALFAIHHVICQTLVRMLALPHAETNAAILPSVMEAMRERAPREIAALAEALGTAPQSIGARISELGGGPRGLGELGASPARLNEALDAIDARPELDFTPDRPERAELDAIIQRAW